MWQKWVIALLFSLSYAFASEIHENSLIIDEEAGALVQGWVDTLSKAAGLKSKVRVYFLASRQVNAGATSGSRIIVNTALIDKCQNVGQFLGVLAHEIGHIEGGHIVKIEDAGQRATVPAAMAVILGAAAAVATGHGEALMAGVASGSHVYERLMLKFTRAQESASDQAAVVMAKKLEWPWLTQGLSDFLKILGAMDMNPGRDPYCQTHPPTPERIATLKTHLPQNPIQVPQDMEAAFQRIRAKFAGYLDVPQNVLKRYPESDTSTSARYARAIAYYRMHKVAQSLEFVNALIQEQPNNPFFHELKGQICLETANISQAKEAFRKALQLRPQAKTYRFTLAQVLIDSSSSKDWSEALKLLRSLVVEDDETLPAWRLLATAYGKLNQSALAAWCLAEEACDQDNYVLAKQHAQRAIKMGVSDNLALSRLRVILDTEKKPTLRTF